MGVNDGRAEATNGQLGADDAGLFDCPECDVTAPSASVPYDALGYAICPRCAHSATPRSVARESDRRTAPL
ncbi:hypothetical protein [Halorubrum pallidum]